MSHRRVMENIEDIFAAKELRRQVERAADTICDLLGIDPESPGVMLDSNARISLRLDVAERLIELAQKGKP